MRFSVFTDWAPMHINFRAALLVAATLFSSSAIANEQLDRLVQSKMEESNIAGLAAAVIVDGKVVWTKGYGFADRETGKPFTPDTVINIASITKNMTGLAMMRAVEEGKLSLDEDINRYLPFKVENPHRPAEKITLRHLATHTSSLIDRTPIYRDSYHYDGRRPEDLATFLKAYYVPGGRHYARENFLDAKPGAKRAYSNIAAGLAGYIVELAVKERLDRYTARHIFQPLGMTRTSWFLADTDMSRHARLYISHNSMLTPILNYELVTYPDGGVRSTVRDLSRYFLMLLGGGELEGKRVLAQSAVAEMQRLQFTETAKPGNIDLTKENSGLFWATKLSTTLVGHGGSDPGVKTEMLAKPAKDVGVVIFMNTSVPPNDMRHFFDIIKELIAYGERIKKGT
jgi:CubicO group peptidase (beta-lactamase class C family)